MFCFQCHKEFSSTMIQISYKFAVNFYLYFLIQCYHIQFNSLKIQRLPLIWREECIKLPFCIFMNMIIKKSLFND